MCVVSMVYDHFGDRWDPDRVHFPWPPAMPPQRPVVIPTQDEIDEFRRLLERAREYDKKTGQPDCELDEKRQALKKIADEMGVDISFV